MRATGSRPLFAFVLFCFLCFHIFYSRHFLLTSYPIDSIVHLPFPDFLWQHTIFFFYLSIHCLMHTAKETREHRVPKEPPFFELNLYHL
ncbi:hypothetical protein J3E68DRAFT_393025 [Trichoderma sp. SZMC 28012]